MARMGIGTPINHNSAQPIFPDFDSRFEAFILADSPLVGNRHSNLTKSQMVACLCMLFSSAQS